MIYDITTKFKRKYKKKTQTAQKSIDDTIGFVIDNPHHPGLHTHKVQGTAKIFEAYIDDEARLTFEYAENKIIFRTNCNHNAVLRNP